MIQKRQLLASVTAGLGSQLPSLVRWVGEHTSPLKRLHQGVSPLLRARGYTWEERRLGDAGLGLWRTQPRGDRTSGERVVLVPGFGDTALSWLPLIEGLRVSLGRERREWVLLDFPGFGGFQSERPCFASFDALVAASSDLLDELKPRWVIAHSLGGWIATEWALRASERAASLATSTAQAPKANSELILVAPAGAVGASEEWVEWRALFERARTDGYAELRAHLFGWAREPWWFAGVLPEIEAFVRRDDTARLLASFDARHELTPRLRGLAMPTTLVWGERDTLTPRRWMDVWVRELKPSTLSEAVTLAGSGHSPQLETPFRLGQLLRDHLSGRDLGLGLVQSSASK